MSVPAARAAGLSTPTFEVTLTTIAMSPWLNLSDSR